MLFTNASHSKGNGTIDVSKIRFGRPDVPPGEETKVVFRRHVQRLYNDREDRSMKIEELLGFLIKREVERYGPFSEWLDFLYDEKKLVYGELEKELMRRVVRRLEIGY